MMRSSDENVSADDFEKRLQCQAPRQIPVAWRREILKTALASVPARRRVNWTIQFRLSALLWPHPKAWAGLAAVWLLIGIFHFVASDNSYVMTRNSPMPSAEVLTALREQQRLWAELIETPSIRVATRPRSSAPQPRSEARIENRLV